MTKKRPRKKDVLAQHISASLAGAEPETIILAALNYFGAREIFVGYSGGFDSLVTTHWMMNNVPGCKVFHANTGIGIEKTREFVREQCRENGWPLVEIRAKEDCGQDYDEMVIKHGFPGPAMHGKMYQRLKERCVEVLRRRNQQKRSDNIMLATGIRHDESQRRAGYKYTVIGFTGNTMWVNPFYYKTRDWFSEYIKRHGLKQNPVSLVLGMSGECLCGAYAHKGELDLIKIVDHATHDRIKRLEVAVREAGHNWGWEDAPIRKKCRRTMDMFMPFCVGCEKVQPKETP